MLIVKVPGVNGLGKTKGTENAPDAIVSSLNVDFKIEGMELDRDNLENQENVIYENSLKFFERDEKIVFLGGDHSISYPIVKAFAQIKKDSCIVVFDAHADCMAPMKEPTHEEWLRALIESGFDPKKVLLIGARNVEKEEQQYIDEVGIKTLSVEKIKKDFESCKGEITEFLSKNLYVSFDMDVFDSSLVKSTGYPEENGLNEREVFEILDLLKNEGDFMAADIVEFNPKKEESEKTLEILKKVLTRFIN